MTPSETNLLQWLAQGGFAALFVWLFWDTRREATRREKELTELARSLQNTIDSGIKELSAAMHDHDTWARTIAKERHDLKE